MSHETALNTFLNFGFRQRELESVLASNAVVDWFGRTIKGRQGIVTFFLNSNRDYEHFMTNAECGQPFEERSCHFLTRKEPLENLKTTPEITGGEQWYDCKTHSPVNIKEEVMQTPPRKSISSVHCPPAPCRNQLAQFASSEEDVSSDDEGLESGIYPLDSSIDFTKNAQRKQNFKRQRLSAEPTEEIPTDSISPVDSKYSNLLYLQTSGTVSINYAVASTPHATDEKDRRECKLYISYRVNREDESDIQIALIMYKCNNSNQKTRRNLMLEFEEREVQDSQVTPSTSRCNTVVKEKQKLTNKMQISTDPVNNKVMKATKRPVSSRNCLRF